MNTNTLIINKKAKKAIEKYGMLKNGSKIIVGLSGGADSVCLLDLFLSSGFSPGLTAMTFMPPQGRRSIPSRASCPGAIA